MFDHQMLDMCELGITNFKGLGEYRKTAKPKEISSRPLMIFDGDGFEHNENLTQLRSLVRRNPYIPAAASALGHVASH